MIYDSNGKLLACGTENGKIKDNIERNLSFDRELFENADGFAVSSPHVQNLFQEEYPWVVTIAVKEKNALFGGDIYIAIDFKFSEIAKYIDNVGIGTVSYTHLDVYKRQGEEFVILKCKNRNDYQTSYAFCLKDNESFKNFIDSKINNVR